jgi:hypothetical protein
MNGALEKRILKISDLLQMEGLTIPQYQRPYKWNERNVQQLFQDINAHKDLRAYRLGTLVFHKDEDGMVNIVDGQQRTLTILMIVFAINENCCTHLDRPDLVSLLKGLEEPIGRLMQQWHFESDISQRNLHQNYKEIERIVRRPDFTDKHIDCLLNSCEVVSFTLRDISEAFQFFDSQNARGRDLSPHDLLKAYHLREFSDNDETIKAKTVEHWEALESDELASLFGTYLYRIRRWALGYSARYFSKNEVVLFKGVNIDNIAHYPYVESLRIAHHYVDHYNRQFHRNIDGQELGFPFHLDQTIINGRRFFEMASHYQTNIEAIINHEQNMTGELLGTKLSATAKKIIQELNTYPESHRTGDRYVRVMFDCALIFYIDKFGTSEVSSAIEKIFIWAYQLRIKQQVVQLATMDNHALSHNIFRTIKDATIPEDVLSMTLRSLTDADNANNKRKRNFAKDPLVKLFKEMNYYE